MGEKGETWEKKKRGTFPFKPNKGPPKLRGNLRKKREREKN